MLIEFRISINANPNACFSLFKWILKSATIKTFSASSTNLENQQGEMRATRVITGYLLSSLVLLLLNYSSQTEQAQSNQDTQDVLINIFLLAFFLLSSFFSHFYHTVLLELFHSVYISFIFFVVLVSFCLCPNLLYVSLSLSLSLMMRVCVALTQSHLPVVWVVPSLRCSLMRSSPFN